MTTTRSPWHVGAQNDALFIIDSPPRPSNDDPRHDADVAVVAKVYNGSAAEANARLIAAAPELLKYLSLAQGYFGDERATDPSWATFATEIDALLKRVNGEQP